MSNKFAKKFKKVLQTEDRGPNDEDTAAWLNSFEEPGDEEQFNTEPVAAGFESRYIEKAKDWIGKIDQFRDWINGTDSNSLNKQFVDLDLEGNAFEGISSHSKKLTSIAEDLGALVETIKGHILSASKQEAPVEQLPPETIPEQ